MKVINKMYCYIVFAVLVLFFLLFHFIMSIVFVFIEPNKFQDIIGNFEKDLFGLIEKKIKGEEWKY